MLIIPLSIATLSAIAVSTIPSQKVVQQPTPENYQQSNQYVAQNNKGTVEATIQYPSDFIPELRVCAQSTSNPYLMNCVDTAEEQRSVEMMLDPGEYYFFSYEEWTDGRQFLFHSVGGFRSGASNAPKPVSVRVGQTTQDVVMNNPFTCSEYPQYCVTPPQ